MPEEIELDPVDTITADAIGKPGERVFYIQARKDAEVITLVLEKIQLQSFTMGVEQFLKEILERFPQLDEASPDFDEANMHIAPPVDPLFHIGDFGLGYDTDRDLAVMVARQIIMEEEHANEALVARFWCTRSQLSALAVWSHQVINQGRPICPQCGEPMNPEGHFCPKKNGHKKH